MFEINTIIIIYIPILGLIATIVAAFLFKGVNRWIALYYVPLLTLVIFYCSGAIFIKPTLDNGYCLGVAFTFMILAGVIVVHYIIISAIAVWLHIKNRQISSQQIITDASKSSCGLAKKIILLAIITIIIIFCAWVFDKFNIEHQKINMREREVEIQKAIRDSAEQDVKTQELETAIQKINLENKTSQKDRNIPNKMPMKELSAPGDTGENPPAESVDWPKYKNQALGFYFQYPPKYMPVVDTNVWPRSVVHLIKTSGGQAYEMTVEIWDNEAQVTKAERTGKDEPYFAMVEHPYTKKIISFSCWNKDTASDCEGIYRTFGFDLGMN